MRSLLSSTNTAIAPFWLLPFTVLVSVLTKGENDLFRLQCWMAAAALSTVLITAGVATYRRSAPHRRTANSVGCLDPALGRDAASHGPVLDGRRVRHDDLGGQLRRRSRW